MKTAIFTIILTALASLSLSMPIDDTQTDTSIADGGPFTGPETCGIGFGCTVEHATQLANDFISRGTEYCYTPTGGRYATIVENIHHCYLFVGSRNQWQARSYCQDVGYGIQKMIKDCAIKTGASGEGVANGNEHFGLRLVGGPYGS